MRELLNSMTGNVTRSSCLAPMQWGLGILVAGLSGTIWSGAGSGIQSLLGGLVAVFALVYLGMTIYFAARDPDALRSERYSIRKMEIERGMIGDNVAGLRELDPPAQITLEPPMADPGGDHGE